MASERLQVILEMVTGNYKREAREAATATGKIGDAAHQSTSGVSSLSKGLINLGAAIGAAGVAKFAFDSIKAASNLEESINAVNVVFGEAAATIHEFGETSVDAVGLAAVNVNQAATVMGSALINAGFAADEAAEKTIELTTRAADMASVFNTEVPAALEAIQSALRGETDPIEKFGVSLTAAAVEAEAAALGYKRVGGEFDSTAKAAARLSLIMKQTERVSGDFQNTADGTANTMKKLKERFIEVQGRIGQALIPTFRTLLDTVDKLVPFFEKAAIAVAELVEEAEPLIEFFGFLAEKIDEASESSNPLIRSAGEIGDEFTILSVLMGDYSDALGTASEQGVVLREELFRLAAEGRSVASGISDANTAIREAPAVLSEAAAAAEGGKAALGRLFPIVSTTAEKYQELARGIRAVISAQLALVNPVVAAVQAQDREREAQEKLTELKDSGEATTRELITAELELAVASAEAQAAQELLREQGIKPTSEALATLADDSLASVVNKLKELELLDDMDIRIIFDLDARLSEQLQSVLPFLEGSFGNASGGPTGGPGVFPRQHGGPVRAGAPYLVGERGPELFVPGQSGTVMPHGWGKSYSPTFNFYSPTGDVRQDLQYATIYASLQNLVENF